MQVTRCDNLPITN